MLQWSMQTHQNGILMSNVSLDVYYVMVNHIVSLKNKSFPLQLSVENLPLENYKMNFNLFY